MSQTRDWSKRFEPGEAIVWQGRMAKIKFNLIFWLLLAMVLVAAWMGLHDENPEGNFIIILAFFLVPLIVILGLPIATGLANVHHCLTDRRAISLRTAFWRGPILRQIMLRNAKLRSLRDVLVVSDPASGGEVNIHASPKNREWIADHLNKKTVQ